MADMKVQGSVSVWLVGSISMANGASVIIMDSLADSIGRRNCVLAGYITYAMSLFIGGFMRSLASVCIFRAISGILTCLALTASYGIVNDVYVKGSRRKNKYSSVLSIGNPLGTVVGYLFGALCVQFIGSWTACNYFLSLLYGIISVLAWYGIPKDEGFNRAEFMKLLKSADYMALFLVVCGYTLVCFSLTQVGVSKDKWKSPYIITLFSLGAIYLFCFVLWEVYAPVKRPLVPMKIWMNRNFSICGIIVFIQSIAFSGIFTYYAVQYFVQLRSDSPMLAFAKLLPGFFVGITADFMSSYILHSFPAKWLMVAGLISYCFVGVIWDTMNLQRNYFAGPIWAISLLFIGQNLMWNIVCLVCYTNIRPRYQSAAAGVLSMVGVFGGVLGLSVSSAIISGTSEGYGIYSVFRDSKQLFNSYKITFYFATGCSVLALLFSFFLKLDDAKDKESSRDSSESSV
ncbi:unnamed protein product [Ambrosiozyma monospora]|uniref:Unnamed protein product n=1 Tax=Ambrosiozyma monospora TaxID=43982 RepID=A0A9W6Z295_AMBMO|nr:unnamed protein product [Ambrosiozyma monospora]